MPSLIDKVKPETRKETLEKAREYVWTTAILYSIIKMKCDFVSSGFDIVHEDDRVEKYFKKIYKKLDMDTYVKNSSFEYFVSGEWVPYFNFKGNEPNYVTIFNPELVDIKTVLGKDFVYLSPSKDIRDLLNKDNPEIKKELMKIIPQKYFNKWKKGEKVYIDGAKRYLNLKAYHEKVTHSPIEPIFPDLELLKTLQEADYTTARKLKQLFLHAKVGGEKFNKGRPVPKEIMKKAESLFDQPYRSAELVTQYFIDMEFISPDVEIFSNEKYESVITRILQWSGMEVLLGEGGSYSEGTIRLKPLKQEIENARKEIEKSLNDFNREVAKRKGFTYYNDLKIPRVKFDNNTLVDQNITNNMLKFAYQHGAVSVQKMLEELGYDFKMQMKQKQEERDEYLEQIYIAHEPSQGLSLREGKNIESNNVDNDTNNQPRPSE